MIFPFRSAHPTIRIYQRSSTEFVIFFSQCIYLEITEVTRFYLTMFVCLYVLTDAQEKQIKIATPGKRASHGLGYSSHPEHLLSTQLCS